MRSEHKWGLPATTYLCSTSYSLRCLDRSNRQHLFLAVAALPHAMMPMNCYSGVWSPWRCACGMHLVGIYLQLTCWLSDWQTKKNNTTNSVRWSPSWEANSSSRSHDIPRILWHPKFHYRAHNSPLVPPILNYIHPAITCHRVFKNLF